MWINLVIRIHFKFKFPCIQQLVESSLTLGFFIVSKSELNTVQPSFDTLLPLKNISEDIFVKVYRVPTNFIETMHYIIYVLVPCCTNHIFVFIMSSSGCLESERPLLYPVRQLSTSQKN